MSTTDSNEYIEKARHFAEQTAARVEEIDEGRRIPADLAADMADAGMFRLLVPRSLGGAEIDHPTFVEIVRMFAHADGSTAWCVNQNNIYSTDSSRMHIEAAETIYGDQRGIITNGPPSPTALAVPADGGYRLTGHWDFSSGSSHGTWLAARTGVQGVDGEPRSFLLPKSDVTMVDTWQVNGLRGTASFSFDVDDVFVPENFTYLESDPARDPGPMYVMQKAPLFPIGFATISLGLARACLDDATELAKQKTQRTAPGAMVQLGTVHRQIGETEATLRAADTYLRSATAAAWESARDHGHIDMDKRIDVRIATTYAIRQASAVVDSAYELFGSDAIFKRNKLQRRYQDMHVIAQQIQGRATNYETGGRYFLGLDEGPTIGL